MKGKLFTLGILVLISLSSVVYAQGAQEAKWGEEMGKDPNYVPESEETPKQRHARMLAQFDEEDFVKGQITFAFTETTTKEEAVSILKKYDLKLQKSEICAYIAGPGEDPKKMDCEIVDSWSDMIKAATVDIPEDKEKEFADKLVSKEEKIIWAEPVYVVTPDVQGAGKVGEKSGKESIGLLEKLVRLPAKFINILINLFR